MPDLTDEQLTKIRAKAEALHLMPATVYRQAGMIPPKRDNLTIEIKRGEILALIAEVRRSRPVVKAAEKWHDASMEPFDREIAQDDELYAAVDAYRAAKESAGG